MAGDNNDAPSSPSGDPPAGKQSWETSRSSSDNNQSDQQSEDQPDMPPGGNSRRPQTPKREADLSGFLNGNEKHELSLLVAKVTDGMQRNILRVFDSTGIDTTEEEPSGFWGKLPANLRDLSLSMGPKQTKENTKPGQSGQQKVGLEEQAQDTIRREEQEALGSGLHELKREMLQSFRRWQMAVNRRVSDISVKNTSASQKGQGPGPTWKKGVKADSSTASSAPASQANLSKGTSPSAFPLFLMASCG